MTSPLAERVVFAASVAVGLREEGGPNQGPPVDLYAGGRQEPWCAHFIATLFRKEGSPLPGDVTPTRTQHNPLAAVAVMWAALVDAGCAVEKPSPGDIVVFNRRGNSDASSSGWHVGLVSSLGHKTFQTIEGNRGDMVGRGVYRLSDSSIVGFARPIDGG